ncbi:acyl carrier protein [Spirillospora sp. NPDC048911]|uniref:acyl carrier protein n=1 Tax=Spirillospora sp. NPDC048911 TaxID=3364527 RepID=UPI00371DA49F
MTAPTETDRDAVIDLVRTTVRDVFAAPDAALAESDVLLDVEGADSARLMVIVGRLEEHYEVDLFEEDVPPARTVGELTDQLITAVQRQSRQ